jgi:hypothetical protein
MLEIKTRIQVSGNNDNTAFFQDSEQATAFPQLLPSWGGPRGERVWGH